MSLSSTFIGGTSLIGFSPSNLIGFAVTTPVLDAVNEAIICIGTLVTSDQGSHTLNTTGSSSIGWRSSTLTFASGTTVVKIGLAAVDTAAGPPGRAVNAADVISFDVSANFTGGGGGITASAYQTSVPTTGTKTVAHGDKIAIAIQMTARGGTDTVRPQVQDANAGLGLPIVTSFLAAAYSLGTTIPNFFITFADGATGWLKGSEIFSTVAVRTYNNSSSPSEFGQLYQFAAPLRIDGIWGAFAIPGDADVILYSDPLGTPVAERTISLDLNTVGAAGTRRYKLDFASYYDTTANQTFAVVVKPTTVTNVSVPYKTLGNAAHRAADPGGTTSYGVSRSGGSGAFANANSSLDHYNIGFMLAGVDDGTGGGGGGVATPLFGGGIL